MKNLMTTPIAHKLHFVDFLEHRREYHVKLYGVSQLQQQIILSFILDASF
jgi:hypothetical protein